MKKRCDYTSEVLDYQFEIALDLNDESPTLKLRVVKDAEYLMKGMVVRGERKYRLDAKHNRSLGVR